MREPSGESATSFGRSSSRTRSGVTFSADVTAASIAAMLSDGRLRRLQLAVERRLGGRLLPAARGLAILLLALLLESALLRDCPLAIALVDCLLPFLARHLALLAAAGRVPRTRDTTPAGDPVLHVAPTAGRTRACAG